MREKPPLPDQRVADLLWDAYGLQIAQLEFLPLGADFNAAVYRLVTRGSASYFLKIIRGAFEETSLLVPRFLHDHGIQQVIPPLETKNGRLWTSLDAYTCILYPFIKGRNAFEIAPSDDQWMDFGAALKRVHTLVLPPELVARVPSETYSPLWREMVKGFQSQVEHSVFDDSLAVKMAAFMRSHRHEIRFLIERAGQLGSALECQSPERVLCHSDVHAGNLLLVANRALYIVDWDNPILAPKERDLMFIGAGVGGTWNSEREEALFYQGYGSQDIDLTALVYFRYERIIQDIAAFCQQILLTREGGDDREQGFQYFTNQFLPNDVIAIAHRTDQKLNEG